MNQKNKTLLAIRVHPWQLFRFKKYLEWQKQRPSYAIQEILQFFFGSAVPKNIMDSWIDEYKKSQGEDA
jgi:hypothetical protein